MKNFLQENSLILSLLVLAVLLLFYGFLFQRYSFLAQTDADGPVFLFRCSNITGECNRFSPGDMEFVR